MFDLPSCPHRSFINCLSSPRPKIYLTRFIQFSLSWATITHRYHKNEPPAKHSKYSPACLFEIFFYYNLKKYDEKNRFALCDVFSPVMVSKRKYLHLFLVHMHEKHFIKWKQIWNHLNSNTKPSKVNYLQKVHVWVYSCFTASTALIRLAYYFWLWFII